MHFFYIEVFADDVKLVDKSKPTYVDSELMY